MFSKELLELDRNTVQLMIDEMQDEIDSQKVQLQEKDALLQKATQDAVDSARKLFENGVSYEVVRTSITALNDDELKHIYEEVKK